MKGVANTERGFSEDALDCLKKSNALVPGDKAVCALLAKAAADKKVDTATAKEVWKETLLTETEKQCKKPWYETSSWTSKFKQCCKRRFIPSSVHADNDGDKKDNWVKRGIQD